MHPLALPCLALAAAGLCRHVATQQPFRWTIQPGLAPLHSAGSDFGPAAAYDGGRGRAVFHPMSPAGGGTETWEWDGASWTQTPVGPQLALEHAAMAYDQVNLRTVLFGGFDGALRDDTLLWDGSAWLAATPALRPPARMRAATFFDPVRQTVVLVGGTANTPNVFPPNPANDFADTWEWNGQTWTQLAPAQAPWPGRCVAAYDLVRLRAVLLPLWGTDTWEWDGATWTAVPSAQMPPRQGYHLATMAFDPTRGTVVYSGSSGTSAPEQWEWDGVDWSPLGTARSPSLPLVFEPAAQSLLLVESQRIWRSENLAPQFVATVATYGNGCGSLFLLPGSLPYIGQTATVVGTGIPVPSTTVATTWLAAGFAPASGVSWPVPGCEVLQTAEVIGLAMTPAGQTSSFDLAVPYQAALRGVSLYLQAFAFAPGQNAAGVVLSNGVELQLGDN